MSRAEALVDATLAHGDKRSAVYRQGAVDVLRLKLEGRHILVPYRAGTVEFDAYFSGNDRGWAIWRRFNEGKVECKIAGKNPVMTESIHHRVCTGF